MAYDDTNCACGGHKLRETMLCADCETAFADTNDMRCFRDADGFSLPSRRGSAIRLLSMARKRKRNVAFGTRSPARIATACVSRPEGANMGGIASQPMTPADALACASEPAHAGAGVSLLANAKLIERPDGAPELEPAREAASMQRLARPEREPREGTMLGGGSAGASMVPGQQQKGLNE